MRPEPIRADIHLPRGDAGADGERRLVEVAVGILIQPDGHFLLTSRPPGKVYAGYWEFPGGKLEAGEGVEQALARELHEELGLTIPLAAVTRWRELLVDYPHNLVRLHFCRVTAWQGPMQMREGQRASWQRCPVDVQPVLAGALPVLEWLAQEAQASGLAPAPSMR